MALLTTGCSGSNESQPETVALGDAAPAPTSFVDVVPSGYQPAVDDAVASFSALVVPVSDDPSLVTDAAAPQTLS